MDNYALQAAAARAHFLSYDQSALIRKFSLRADSAYLYMDFLALPYRLNRTTGDLEKLQNGQWCSGNSHSEVMTLLDILCDSREDRFLSGKWQSMEHFSRTFHRSLLEDRPTPEALLFDREPERLHRGCQALGGIPAGKADIGYRVELFGGLPILVELWHSDEEFPPQLRFLWDENSLMYLRYETMWYAVDLLTQRILEAG